MGWGCRLGRGDPGCLLGGVSPSGCAQFLYQYIRDPNWLESEVSLNRFQASQGRRKILQVRSRFSHFSSILCADAVTCGLKIEECFI